ncbi:hypothetical protein N7456_006060 [Penicillium angulare]|uniref:Membrane insertase YidC/Oxa/ALB C-terminal domain-containing protein n=1 Tax=Penicillium angulare TaxID=116970 RepID=A0A9W9G0H8_9EURO|nr:hypothetical protein N7456_006060 [Penicillium angulare]
MMSANGLKGASAAAAFARQRLAPLPGSSRSLSTLRAQRVRIPSSRGQLPSGLSNNVTRFAMPAVVGSGAIRFNSTTPTPEPTPEAAAGELADIDLSTVDISKIPEHIGYLKELGLTFGWGTSTMMEWTLEHIHMWSGLPWWASIVSLGLLVRLALLKPSIEASHQAALNHNIKPLTGPLRHQMLQASKDSNHMEVARTRAQLQELHKQHGVSMWKSFLPMIQVPLGFGMFRVIRGMTSLPVPALLNEKTLWLSDLTLADPYYLLPAISAFSMYLTFKKGGEAGMTDLFNTSAGKSLLIGLPSISFVFMSWMPAALQLYFVATGAWAVGQSHILNNNSFRRFMKMEIAQKSINTPEYEDSLKQLTKRLQEDRQKRLHETTEQFKSQVDPKTHSFIDRLIKGGTDHFKKVKSEASDKLKEVSGSGAATNADGSPAAKPRLTEAQRKAALKDEEQQMAWNKEERERRNEERRLAFKQAMSRDRNRAKRSFDKKQ